MQRERLPRDVQAAERAYRKLDLTTQYRLCREIVDTRSADLVLAYHNLVSVGYGYKTSRRAGRPGGEHVDVRQPCIVFVVSRKWRTKKTIRKAQALPSCLYAYATVAGERVRCAVPTDVKTLSSYGTRARAHLAESDRPYGVAIENDDERTWGVVTCAIKRPAEPATLYALSCRHVFSMSLDGPETASGCSVRSSGSGEILGITTSIRGPLVPAPADSFDAQLAKVTNRAALQAALPGMRFDPAGPCANDESEISPDGFWILTPRRDAQGRRLKVWVKPRDYISKTLPYDDLQVVHHGILHAIADDLLRPGDSGSPAVPVPAGGKLLGMYIGGDGTNAYIIPAWQLVRGAYYGRMGESLWTVVNP